jgi:class 3 adenylate cyclase
MNDRRLPSGTLTFLFTDIEGSTRPLKQLGDRYADALGAHQQILRAAFDAHGRRALAVQGTNPRAAGPLWAAIDRAVVDRAPWVSAANPTTIDLASARVGNYQYNPQWGILLDQVWLR